MWKLAGAHAPDHQASVAAPVVVDVDATLVTAHSDKEHAEPTDKAATGVVATLGKQAVAG